MSDKLTRNTIYYNIDQENGGQKPWLTMIHGFSQTHKYFSAQVPVFRKHFQLFLPDLRGHGKSAALKGPFGIEEYAEDIIAALDDKGIEQTHYWGTHTGAAIGLLLAIRYPKRIESLVLEGATIPGFKMPRVAELLNIASATARLKGVGAALENWFGSADWFSYIREHPEQCRSNGHAKMVFEFQGSPWLSTLLPKQLTVVADLLSDISQPVFVYNGEHDMPDFKRAAIKLEADLPNVRSTNITDAGGFPGWENPHVVNALVYQFLNEIA